MDNETIREDQLDKKPFNGGKVILPIFVQKVLARQIEEELKKQD